MSNWKGCGRKRSWSNFKYYLSTFLEGRGKITKTLHHDSRSLGLGLNTSRIYRRWQDISSHATRTSEKGVYASGRRSPEPRPLSEQQAICFLLNYSGREAFPPGNALTFCVPSVACLALLSPNSCRTAACSGAPIFESSRKVPGLRSDKMN
jgi:hypothetical protein